jgi:excisionase family DNA binding protein
MAVTTTTAAVWLTVREASARARCGPKVIYRAARGGHLRAAKIGGRAELRFRAEWIDAWLDALATPRAVECR